MIEFNLNKELSNVNVIKAFVKDSLEQYGYIDETRLNEYIKNVFQGDEDVDVITISPDAVIKYIVPYEENSMMVGFDLLSSENRHEYVYRAMDINNAVAQGPILTNQGKLHVINRIPTLCDRIVVVEKI